MDTFLDTNGLQKLNQENTRKKKKEEKPKQVSKKQ